MLNLFFKNPDGTFSAVSAAEPLPVDVGASFDASGLATEITADRTADAVEAIRDNTSAVPTYPFGREYEACPASATTTLGATGAVGDDLDHIIIVPGTTSPGAVSIKDGSDTAIVVFAGGASSVATLHSWTLAIGMKSRTGAWQIVTGSNVTVLPAGNFT